MVNYEALVSRFYCLDFAELQRETLNREQKGKKKRKQRRKEEQEVIIIDYQTFPLLHEQEDQPVGIMDASCASVPKPAPD